MSKDALNAVCPYYTMYPLDFPLRVLKEHGDEGDWVIDPFCGRDPEAASIAVSGPHRHTAGQAPGPVQRRSGRQLTSATSCSPAPTARRAAQAPASAMAPPA